jgi:Fe2+ or Zn2+ uptake regulation protein
MLKKDLFDKVAQAKEETRIALQTMYDALNQGQQKKIVKDAQVKALFDRYGVSYN